MSLPVFHRTIGGVFRVLKPGSSFRIILPDAELYLRRYVDSLNGINVVFPYENFEIEKTPLMSVNRVFRNFGHEYAWDFQTVKYYLELVGFNDVTRFNFNVGRDKNLLLDTKERACESLYIEAIKP